MALVNDARSGIIYSTAENDPLVWARIEGDLQQVAAVMAVDKQGALAGRPAASAANRGWYWTDDGGTTTRSNGVAWLSVGGGGGGYAVRFLAMAG